MAPVISLPGLLEATATIFLTTLEDCIWLVAFVAQAPDRRLAIINGCVFVLTFCSMTVITCVLALALDKSLSQFIETNDFVFQTIGAAFCWILAGILYYKAWRSMQRKRQSTPTPPSTVLVKEGEEPSETYSYGAVEDQRDFDRCESSLSYDDGETAAIWSELPPTLRSVSSSQQWVVVSLTLLGSIDEIAYFPGLVVGQIFTVTELCLGSLMAALMILFLVDVLVRHCRMCLFVLDQIPIYAVVTFFALVLSLQVIYELANK